MTNEKSFITDKKIPLSIVCKRGAGEAGEHKHILRWRRFIICVPVGKTGINHSFYFKAIFCIFTEIKQYCE